MIIEFTDYLDGPPTNSNIIFAGDFNFYSSNESDYQKILNNNNNVQNWHNHTGFINYHTQATR